MNKILVAMPHGRNPEISSITSLRAAIKCKDAIVVESHLTNGITNKLRNEQVDRALEEDYTHILFVDNDMVYPIGMLEQLLKHDKDMVCGWYCRKVEGFISNAFIRSKGVIEPFYPTDEGLHEICAAGTGCMLVKTSVFSKIEEPYFWYRHIESFNQTSEDMEFCAALEKAGVKMWLDASVRCWHIGSFMVRPVIGSLEPEMTAVPTDCEVG